MWGELAADGEKRGKERAKGSSDGCGGRSQLSALSCGEGSGGVQGGNQFRIVCAGRLGCLFDKPRVCNLTDRRLSDKLQTCDLIDRYLFDKHQTCNLVGRCLFDKHQTYYLIDRFLFDKPRTRALINRCLFACGEFARSISRGCLIVGIRERVGLHRGWPATGRLCGKGGVCWGKTRLRASASPLRADLRA